MAFPILYSYRRCPYAMRARMALHMAGIATETREIALRDKPIHLLQVSPKGTVPVLILPDGTVLEQSLEIMLWALRANDPAGWLKVDESEALQWIAQNDSEFKAALDRYKYPERFPEQTQDVYRAQGELFLKKIEAALEPHSYLLGSHASIADVAIFPFVRQFAAVDAAWFSQLPYPSVARWLSSWVESALFETIMRKQPVFQP